jgi:hypothetical protein
MRFFNNYWFRWVAGGVLGGAVATGAIRATGRVKDLKVESASGRFAFSDASAWMVLGGVLGVVGAIAGLWVGCLTKLARRTYR